LDCTIGHDVVIEDFVTLSPGVHVSGNVHIKRGAFIGTGVNILNGSSETPLVIDEGCVVAAGACITRPTEPYTMYAGVPAVAKKKLGKPD
jgi:acetyltransferase-like isoleucine patch superfamily enzyme